MDNPRLAAAFALMQNKEVIDGNIRAARAIQAAYNLRYQNTRRATDRAFHLLCILRSRIGAAVRSAGTRKSSKTIRLLGCSIPQFKAHLETQFKPGMDWTNVGEWEIDHIKPCCKFNLLLKSEQQACFHFSNLQPLWKQENRIKGGRHAPA